MKNFLKLNQGEWPILIQKEWMYYCMIKMTNSTIWSGNKIAKLFVTIFWLLGGVSVTQAQSPAVSPSDKWVDSVMQTLDTKEKIAQLINIAAFSNRDQAFEDSISAIIREYKIGGLIFFQGGPVRQAKLTNRYQAESEIPLLISIDAEWGLGMRLDSAISYPYNMALGAIQDDDRF